VNRTAKITVLFCLFYLSGCSSYTSNSQYHPSTTYNESVRTNLYGELDGWEPVSFSAKPFSSLVQHSFCEEGGDYDPDISADAKWIVFSSLRHSPNPDLYIKQVYGSTSTRLTSDAASEIQPTFSPNGEFVAYASNRAGNWDIWVVGVDGSNPTRITDSATNDIHPSWSPDGKQIVYCSHGSRSKQWELWIVSVETTGIKKWIGYGLFPEWNPNPKVPKIAFQLARYRGSQWFSIWTVDLVNGEAKFPTEIISSIQHACICPAWSADGTHITYGTVSRNEFEKAEAPVPDNQGEDIWIVDLDGRNNLQLTISDSSNFSPSWSPDGRVFYCSDRKGIENIWSIQPNQINFNAQNPIDLSQHPQNSGIQAN
jgi:TolB protein